MNNRLKTLACTLLFQLSLAAAQAQGPVDNVPIEGTAASTGTAVAKPGKMSRPSHERLVDKLPAGEKTEAERSRLNSMHFETDPRHQIVTYINHLKPQNGPPVLSRGNLYFLDSAALKETFPSKVFYVLRFPQWPIASPTPQPLGTNNIFVVGTARGELELITESKKNLIKQLFQQKSTPSVTEAAVRRKMESSLVLAEELEQDGMYKFSPGLNSLTIERKDSTLEVSAARVVNPTGGNSGTIFARMLIDKNTGAVRDFSYEAKLQAGMRPICQSTKLLDPDPLVRKMAEQDILMMGSSAKEYLDYQRSRVSPELQQAIDKIWERIVREGR